MPSSIFNSDYSKNANQSWYYSWLLIIVFCLFFLGSYEFFLKKEGFIASIDNNKNLWSWYRDDIYHDKQMVIVGASRSQVDINIPYLKNKYSSYKVAQLSVNAQYPMSTLKSLAYDVKFKGIVIVSLNAQALEAKYLGMQQAYNDYYNNQSSLYKSLDAYLFGEIQSKLRLMHPLLGLEQVVKFFAKNKKFPDVFYTSANLDQSISADYTKTDVSVLLKHFVQQKLANYQSSPPTDSDLWNKHIELLTDYSNLIKHRGGNVLFVRFPTDKGHWELDEEYYPRKKYWDKIANDTVLSTLHFKDIEGMEKFDLPDSSHLDQKDTKAFTELLFNKIIIQ